MTVAHPGAVGTPPGEPDPHAASPRRSGKALARTWWPAIVAAAALLGLAHALAVAPHYHVGSFDDDANYILAARALAAGAGLTTKLRGVAPLVAVYPPGYPALLAPLALLWPHGVLAFRGLSLASFVALFPLTWVYLRRRSVDPLTALAVLLLLALSPLAATYATMVMAELPFLVVLLVLLLVLPRWELQTRTITGAGVATVVLASGLIWLKEAGVGLVIGVFGWLLLRRLWRKAALTAAGTAMLLSPVLIGRVVAGVAIIGSRYSTEVGGPYPGGLVGRVLHLPPSALNAYLQFAAPRSILPTDVSPLPVDGPLAVVFGIVQWTAVPLVVVGFVVWARRHRDVTCIAIPVYLLETLLFPFTNERRVILILPVILAWYVLGAWTVLGAIVQATRASANHAIARAGPAVPGLAVVLALGALLPQFPRDYLFAYGQDSSSPAGSPYMKLLRQVDRSDDVVESSYLWSTALFTGHPTANAAFNVACDKTEIDQALRSDDAGFLLSAALNQPGIPDALCILPLVADQPGMVRLYRSPRDLASVFELIGPGSPHPDLVDLVPAGQVPSAGSTVVEVPEPAQVPDDPAGSYPTTPAVAGQASLTWSWGQAQPISQISLGAAAGSSATTTSVRIELLGPDGVWRTVVAAPGPVGATDATPFLLASFPNPKSASAVRVVVAAQGTVEVHDLDVLGPTP